MAGVTMYLMIFVSTSIQEERGTRMADMLLIPLRAIEIVAGKVLSTELLAAIVLVILGGSSAALAMALHGTHIAGEAPYTLAALERGSSCNPPSTSSPPPQPAPPSPGSSKPNWSSSPSAASPSSAP